MGEYVNSQTARFDKSHVSCGVVEVHHLPKDKTPNSVVFAIANHLYHKANPRPAAFILFSDVVVPAESSRGLALSTYISAMKCGVLQFSPKEINPKTGNVIQVWVWSVNHENLRKWYTDQVMNAVHE